MLVANKYEFVEECPINCKFKDDMSEHGQNSICGRCPVFVCKPDPKYGALVDAPGYREDWAKEWKMFFDGEIEKPTLAMTIVSTTEIDQEGAKK